MSRETVTISPSSSANRMEHQTPFNAKKIGSTSTQTIWNTSVRAKEIIAETSPSFNAVKKAEPKMLNPHSRNENAYSFSACSVSYIRPVS